MSVRPHGYVYVGQPRATCKMATANKPFVVFNPRLILRLYEANQHCGRVSYQKIQMGTSEYGQFRIPPYPRITSDGKVKLRCIWRVY